MNIKPIIFSDIDGTLIDLTTFDPGPALKIIPLVKKFEIPIILCSAKTALEQIKIRKSFNIEDPFIVENGGGIYIPKGYFPKNLIKCVIPNIVEDKDYVKCCLGKQYKDIINIVQNIRRNNRIHFVGFCDLTPYQISQLTGLSENDSYLAKNREFDETIVDLDVNKLDILKRILDSYGLRLTFGGRFYHVMDKNISKGKAVQILTTIYKEIYDNMVTIGIGDNENDVEMLTVVDYPYLVEKKGGGFAKIDLPKIKKIKGIGPNGWANAIQDILKIVGH